jgi:hypothetical protein
VDFGVFVCTNCASIHREFYIKVKGIGVTNFKKEEIQKMKDIGNEVSYILILERKGLVDA